MRQGALDLDSAQNGLSCGGKGDEERVALGADLVAVVALKSLPHQVSMLLEDKRVHLAQALQELCRALDVGEHQGDGPGWCPSDHTLSDRTGWRQTLPAGGSGGVSESDEFGKAVRKGAAAPAHGAPRRIS